MVLVGQYDSPFVRRVAIALQLYGYAYEHRPWSVFADAERVREMSPLCRVPILLTDEGAMLLDSAAILDHLDEAVGADRALLPAASAARLGARRRLAYATGVCEKAVALIYERVAHTPPSTVVVTRCSRQIVETLAVLEAELAGTVTPFFHGATPGHDDIALACAAGFLAQAHPDLLAGAACRTIARHASQCEALPAFQAVRQALVPPT